MCFSTRMAQLNLKLRNISFVGCWGSHDLETSTCSWRRACGCDDVGIGEVSTTGAPLKWPCINWKATATCSATCSVRAILILPSRDDALQPPHSGLSRLSAMNDAENLQEIIMLNQVITSGDTMPGLRHELHLQSEFLKSEEEAMSAMTAMTS